MQHHDAAEHLQVIRTLMERSALYRRTLAPIMLYVGSVGTLAGAGGIALRIEGLREFGAWWLGAAVVALAGAFVIARRQSLQDGEPFWSPPTLRVTQAMAPPLAVGLILSVAVMGTTGMGEFRLLLVFPDALLYGCAVHAAGFFMPRGMKLFGWIIIGITGVTLLVQAWATPTPGALLDHAFMGALFGLLHLAYGVYLYITEPREKSA
jgi:hypothetical protein